MHIALASQKGESSKTTIVGTAVLRAIARALARIHVEHDDLWRSPRVQRAKHTLLAAMTPEPGICPPKAEIRLAGGRYTKVYRAVSGLNQVFRVTNLKLNLVAIVLFAVSQNAFAQQPIGAGGMIQQIPQAPVAE